MAVRLREVECMECGCPFHLCRSCDRGQCYCSERCRRAARERSLRRARRKYAHSEKGRLSNCYRQRRHRERRRNVLESLADQKSVTDHSSHRDDVAILLTHEVDHFGPRSHAAHRIVSAPHARTADTEDDDGGQRGEPRCHLCGRRGVVVRQVCPRGRFRWAMRPRRE